MVTWTPRNFQGLQWNIKIFLYYRPKTSQNWPPFAIFSRFGLNILPIMNKKWVRLLNLLIFFNWRGCWQHICILFWFSLHVYLIYISQPSPSHVTRSSSAHHQGFWAYFSNGATRSCPARCVNQVWSHFPGQPGHRPADISSTSFDLTGNHHFGGQGSRLFQYLNYFCTSQLRKLI